VVTPPDKPSSTSPPPPVADVASVEAAGPVRWGGWGALIILLAWGGMVGLSLLISISTGRDVPTCLFRRATGLPCATCGGTRVVYALSRGDLATALELNPLVTLFLLGSPVVALLVWHRSRRRALARSPVPRTRQRQIVWVAILLLCLSLNWIYVARAGSLARQPTSSLAERWKQRTQSESPAAPLLPHTGQAAPGDR
jgi:hypothetical protein